MANIEALAQPQAWLTPLPEGFTYTGPDRVTSWEEANLRHQIEAVGHWTFAREIDWVFNRHKAGGGDVIGVGVRDDFGMLAGYGDVMFKGTNGELTSLVVSPRHQHKGLAKAIILERIRLAEEAGIIDLYIPYLEPTNKLETFYIEQGFRKTRLGALGRGDKPVSITGIRPQSVLED